MRGRLWLGPVAAVLLVSGCGQAPTAEGDAELTSKGVAAVMLDHLDDDTSTRKAAYVDGHSPDGLVGADFFYGGTKGATDGILVEVTVARAGAPKCEEGCADLGQDTRLHWDLVEPEEDPGVVTVTRTHGDELVMVHLSGPTITKDPREMADLVPSVDTMAALARDSRLALSTTAETVAAGEVVTDWGGGEVPAEELEEVPHTDKSLAVGVLGGFGHDWTYVGPSPVKADLGGQTVAGRVKVGSEFEPVGPGMVDVFAVGTAPAWAQGDCKAGFTCVDLGHDATSPADDGYAGIRLMWRPAAGDDPGEAWYVNVRRDESMGGFHVVGPRLPADPIEAAASAGIFLWGDTLLHQDRDPYVDLFGTREAVEAAERQ